MYNNDPFSMQFFKQNDSSSRSLVQKLAQLPTYQSNVKSAEKYGLAINTVSWEDTARDKNSCVGPNISDITLCVANYDMPMIRRPNYSDVSCDMPIDKFNVTVGNETFADLKRISLKDFLKDISTYTDSNVGSMLLDRDVEILTSAQACVLPVDKTGSVEFNVRLFNYQYKAKDPAVLVVIASANGTSCQVITEYQQKLYFNDNGMAANFVAKGLTQHRKEQGTTSASSDLNQEEKEQNALFVFQIPLKQKYEPPLSHFLNSSNMEQLCAYKTCSCSSSQQSMIFTDFAGNFEDAILSTKKTHSTFKGTQGLKLERDDRFPIRCTIQFYKISDREYIPEEEFGKIADKINNIYQKADIYGSLVTDGKTKRVTEPELSKDTKIKKNLPSDERDKKPLMIEF